VDLELIQIDLPSRLFSFHFVLLVVCIKTSASLLFYIREEAFFAPLNNKRKEVVMHSLHRRTGKGQQDLKQEDDDEQGLVEVKLDPPPSVASDTNGPQRSNTWGRGQKERNGEQEEQNGEQEEPKERNGEQQEGRNEGKKEGCEQWKEESENKKEQERGETKAEKEEEKGEVALSEEEQEEKKRGEPSVDEEEDATFAKRLQDALTLQDWQEADDNMLARGLQESLFELHLRKSLDLRLLLAEMIQDRDSRLKEEIQRRRNREYPN